MLANNVNTEAIYSTCYELSFRKCNAKQIKFSSMPVTSLYQITSPQLAM